MSSTNLLEIKEFCELMTSRNLLTTHSYHFGPPAVLHSLTNVRRCIALIFTTTTLLLLSSTNLLGIKEFCELMTSCNLLTTHSYHFGPPAVLHSLTNVRRCIALVFTTTTLQLLFSTNLLGIKEFCELMTSRNLLTTHSYHFGPPAVLHSLTNVRR